MMEIGCTILVNKTAGIVVSDNKHWNQKGEIRHEETHAWVFLFREISPL